MIHVVHYNPENVTREFTKTEELRPFKGVQIRDPARLKGIEIPDSTIQWVEDTILADGNVVYIEDADGLNPFVYRDDSDNKGTAGPTKRTVSKLVSAEGDMEIEFSNQYGWWSVEFTSPISIHPIADDYVLEQIGAEQELLVHEM